MEEKQITILLNAWEMYQNLAKGLGESCWKIKSIGIGFWSAIIGYAYKEKDSNVFFFSILIIVFFFMFESGMRRLQYKYIQKSIEIEKSINDYLVGDSILLPNEGISTNVETPTMSDFFYLFELKRWMFWLPHAMLLVCSIFLVMLNNANIL